MFRFKFNNKAREIDAGFGIHRGVHAVYRVSVSGNMRDALVAAPKQIDHHRAAALLCRFCTDVQRRVICESHHCEDVESGFEAASEFVGAFVAGFQIAEHPALPSANQPRQIFKPVVLDQRCANFDHVRFSIEEIDKMTGILDGYPVYCRLQLHHCLR